VSDYDQKIWGLIEYSLSVILTPLERQRPNGVKNDSAIALYLGRERVETRRIYLVAHSRSRSRVTDAAYR
jgi:hypothetical protein